MSFLAQCSFCGHKIKARDRALGASVRCPECDNYFTAAPREEPAPAEALARFRFSKPAPTPVAAAAQDATPDPPDDPAAETDQAMALPANPALAAMGTGEIAPEAPESLPPEVDIATGRAFGWRVHIVGVAALLLAGAGLACASIPGLTGFTIPLGAAGLLAGLAGLSLCTAASRPALLFPVVASVAGAAVLIIGFFFPGLLGPVYEDARARVQDKTALTVIPLSLKVTDPAELSVAGWVDASKAAVQQDQVRLQLASARIGPIDLAGEPATTTKENYLLVRFRLQHVGGTSQVQYEHWKASSKQGEAPRLTDSDGRVLALALAKLGQKLRAADQRTGATLYPTSVIDDVLVFTPPRAAADLRLELPASAWGGIGVFRFHLPAAMIKDSRQTEKLSEGD
jgi:hypothetical protein